MFDDFAKDEAMAHLMLIDRGDIVPGNFKKTRDAYLTYGSFQNMLECIGPGLLSQLHIGIGSERLVNICKTFYEPNFNFDIMDYKQLRYSLPSFSQNPFAPPVLYLMGNKSMLFDKNVFVTGQRFTRKEDERRVSVQRELIETSKDICRDFIDDGKLIFTGLSEGMETVAANIGMKKKSAIAILGTSLTGTYPVKNRFLKEKFAYEQLAVSAQPPFLERIYRYDNGSFYVRQRNKLIAHISSSLFVSQATDNGWASDLIHWFKKLEKPVMTSYDNYSNDIGTWKDEFVEII